MSVRGHLDLVRAARAFADPTRVRIVALLRRGELCVCDLVEVLGITQSTLSTHLRVVRDAGLVSTRRSGRWVHYSLTPHGRALVAALVRRFCGALESDPVVRRDAERASRRCGC